MQDPVMQAPGEGSAHFEPPTPLVVDDGGFSTSSPDGAGFAVGLSHYETLAELAERHGLRVPLAVTAGFVDLGNLSGEGLAGPESSRLVDFLKRHESVLPVWNHGLTHRYGDHLTEFGVRGSAVGVPEEVQARSVELSQAIFADLGLAVPQTLVPPGHAWEPGVTDRLASRAGIRAIAIREFEKTSPGAWLVRPWRRFERAWPRSDFLGTLYRSGLGVAYDKRRFESWDLWKARQFARPSPRWLALLIHRTPSVRPPHHFYAHIQNFTASSVGFWDRLIPALKEAVGERAGDG